VRRHWVGHAVVLVAVVMAVIFSVLTQYGVKSLIDVVSHGPDAVEWENRYNSMKGRYDKSQEIIAQMQQTMSQMSQDIMGLQNALQARAAAQAPEPQRLIPKEVEDQYGAEFIELMRSAAKEALGPELERVTRENNQLKERLNVSNVQNLWATMDRIMPKWRQVNQSEEFKQWVGLRDPLSGAIRGDLLNAAFRAGNAERVMAFFRGFDPNIEAAPSPAGSTTAPPTAHAPGPVSLETLAAPGRARSAPASDVAAEKPVFTPADISRFYNDKSRGGWLGREQEADRIERAIFLAQREGRVRVQ